MNAPLRAARILALPLSIAASAAFTSSLPPRRALRSGDSSSGVRRASPAMRSAASRIAAKPGSAGWGAGMAMP